MPIYEFKCEKCQLITSELLSIKSKKKQLTCEFCGRTAKRIMSVTGGIDVKGFNAKNGYSKGDK